MKYRLMLALIGAASMLEIARTTNVYVVPSGTHIVQPGWIYTNWATAATNIQDAINTINTNGGNIVYISNGVYLLTNELTVNKGVILRSWRDGATDRDGTIIHANNYAGKPVTNRCLNSSHAGVVLDGLTFYGGYYSDGRGGGIYATAGIVITNCAIISNAVSSTYYGGGLNFNGGGNVLITDSLIAYNSAGQGGGGLIFNSSATVLVVRCQIISNEQTATTGDLGGGGAYLSWGNIISNCIIAYNRAGSCGGGVFIRGGEVVNCQIISNSQTTTGTQRGGAGLAFYANGGIARNCLIAYNTNSGTTSAAIYFNNTTGIVENCTIVSNTSGVKFRNYGMVLNSIIYDNINTSTYAELGSVSCSYCCVTSTNGVLGAGNFTNAPLFVAPGDFHLQPWSPCVNAGTNQAWMENAVDLDGRRRLDSFSRQVDLGCYERLPRGALYQVR